MKFATLPSVGNLKLHTTTGLYLPLVGVSMLYLRFRALFFVLLAAYILYTFYLTAKVANGKVRTKTYFFRFRPLLSFEQCSSSRHD